MDHFGIGAAVQGAARVYFQSARRTGRTTSLVESLKDGDRVVFRSHSEAEHVLHMCKDRGVNVECIVIDPEDPSKLFERNTSEGRTLFDHTWVEQYYFNVIAKAQRDIDYIERETSGYGAAHLETRRRAVELAKWQV